MKKNRFMKVAFFALLFAAAQFSFGQSKLDAEPITPELKVAADNVILLSTSDPDKANSELIKVIRKYKKESELASLARYFYEQEQIPLARFTGQKAYEKGPEYLPALSVLGDTYVKTGELGKAGQMFDVILRIDPTEKSTMLKTVDVYRNVNPEVAKETLIKLKEMDPSYYQADRELAAIYYATNDIPQAIEAFARYFKAYPQGDDKSKQEYALALFVSGQYEKSLEVVEDAIKTAPKEVSLTRMRFFNLFETDRHNDAKKAMDEHFSLYHDTIYNFSDYLYKGKLLDALSDTEGAITAFEKSLSLNADNLDTYVALSNAYRDSGNMPKAIETYKSYLAKKGDKAELRDRMTFGRLYYTAAQKEKDAAIRTQYVKDGMAEFAYVAEKSPESGSAPFWIARINILADPEKPHDIVKEYYEKALALFAQDNSTKSSRMECYNYFTFYAFHKDDYAAAREYNKKALEIDPENEMARNIAEALKKLK